MLMRSSAARRVRSCTRKATTDVPVLLESSVARVLGSVVVAAAAAAAAESDRVLVTEWPRRARVCLVLVALEQSSDRGSMSSFCEAIRHARNPGILILMGSDAALAVRSCT